MIRGASIRNGAAAAVALSALLLGACGDSPSDPGRTVASVAISPDNPSVVVGSTIQLTATVQSSSGGAVTGVTVSWQSESQGVATVTQAGRVAGIAPGTSRIIATAGGRADTVTVTVTVPSSVVITSIAPATVPAGGTITITGEGFSTTPSQNVVTIGGIVATVTAATATQLTVTVPAAVCAAPGTVAVRVTVGGMVGELAHPWQGTPALQVAVGQQQRLEPAASQCLNLGATTGAVYLVGVQSVSGLATSLTPVVVRGIAPAAAGAAAFTMPEPAAGLALGRSRADERRTRARAAELRFRFEDREATRHAVARRTAPLADANAAAVAANAAFGDTIELRYPRAPNTCTQFTPVRGVVRKVGARAIWIEDVTNPAGGFTAAQYDDLSNQFDGPIYATNVEYFGEPTDFDGNNRIIILLTREVNKDGVFGRVFSADFFPTSDCPASNVGEIFYGIAPDPDSVIGATFRMTALDAMSEMPTIIAHELAHVIQFGRRLTTPGVQHWPTIWELEGQATFAEEVVGHSVTNRQPRQNYGFDVGWGQNGSPEAQWYRTLFFDLALYFGMNPTTNPPGTVPGAPEQCGWLGRPEGNNLGPCFGRRLLYGVSWSFLRWISDHYGPQHPGGEKGLHRAMIQSTDTGFATLSRLTSQPHDALLARWAAALYVDDRVPGADPLLTFASWNLSSIFGGLIQQARLRPYERTLASLGSQEQVQVRAGSSAYFRISAGGPGVVSLTGPEGAALPGHMRVWVVRLQ
jgi:hypothetical protein